jgi:hypothetical protein
LHQSNQGQAAKEMSWNRSIIGQASLMQVNNNSFGMLFSFLGVAVYVADEVVNNLSEGGIEIRVDKAARLFHTLDPLPFRERDLAKDAEEFIIGLAREIPKGRPITIVVHLPKAEVRAACSAMRITILRTVQRMRPTICGSYFGSGAIRL